jgi:hypothetical protein
MQKLDSIEGGSFEHPLRRDIVLLLPRRTEEFRFTSPEVRAIGHRMLTHHNASDRLTRTPILFQ